ncbi:MAG: EAL domain-containing protein [Sporomusaceae bacterium]|nr:EAL domain-containing protein [Sporomusaceae bacterium]
MMTREDNRQTAVAAFIDNAFYKSILEQARDMIFIVDAAGWILGANRAVVANFGYSAEELRQMRVHDLREPAMRDSVDEYLVKSQREGILFRAVYVRKDSTRFTAEVSSRQIQVAGTEVVISIVRDITAALAAEQSLQNSEAELRLRNADLTAAYEELAAAHEELTATHEELTASEEELRQQLDELLKRDAEIRRQNSILTLLHETARGLMHRLDPKALLQQIVVGATELLGTPHGFIYRLDRRRGVFYRSHGVGIYEQDTGREMALDEGVTGAVYQSGEAVAINNYQQWRKHNLFTAQFPELTAMLQIPLRSEGRIAGTIGLAYCEEGRVFGDTEIDVLSRFAELASIALDNSLLIASLENEVRERKQKEEANWRLAYYDTLTGLPNRTFFYERFAEEFALVSRGRNRGGSIMLMDIDELKVINDTLGHACGDIAIARAGGCIAAVAGPAALAARVAGDEFAVLLPGETDRTAVAGIADQIIKQLARGFTIDGIKLYLSASMGVAVYPDDGDSVVNVMQKVDMALNEAKRSGKGTWRFCEAKSQMRAYENMILIRALRDAVSNTELTLRYQPLINARTGEVASFEALLRWTSPDHGAVSPARFIPLAEESNIIRQLGQWVLEEACRFIRRLAASGNGHIAVSINVSPRQLAAEDFVALVKGTIEREQINPRQLEIEITETVLMTSVEESTHKLTQLRDSGVRLALDDFGTGYSSLTYLRSLPVDRLKIDKSFIDRIASDNGQLQLISSIIDMAHSLGLTVVAEGVETKLQLAKLVECQCDYIQGYVFSRPVVEPEAVRFLTR